MKFTVLDQNGQKVECEVEELIYNDETGINYIVYNDGTRSENGSLKIYAARYKEVNGKYILEDIENDSEWDYIDKYLSEI